jgi:uncharacterized LabA/DUF88 family protein
MAFDAQRKKLLVDIKNLQCQLRDLEAAKVDCSTVVQQWQAYSEELKKEISLKMAALELRDRQVHQQNEYIAFLTNLNASNKVNES